MITTHIHIRVQYDLSIHTIHVILYLIYRKSLQIRERKQRRNKKKERKKKQERKREETREIKEQEGQKGESREGNRNNKGFGNSPEHYQSDAHSGDARNCRENTKINKGK